MTWHWHFFCFIGWLSLGIITEIFQSPIASYFFFPIFPLIWFSIPFFYAYQAFTFSFRRGASFFSALLNGFIGYFHFPYYLWVRRLSLKLNPSDKKQILKDSKKMTNVSEPDSLYCPFCQIEIPHALRIVSNNALTTTKRPLLCPRCALRFDCCRYCQHYEMSTNQFTPFDRNQGKCKIIKEVQNVDTFCNPSMAKRLREMGWENLYASIVIHDNFSPPDRCRQFIVDGKKMLLDHIPEMGNTRVLLIKIQHSLKDDHSEHYSQASSP